MNITAKTDAGIVRKYNQDCYAAGEFSDGAAWAVVCDGMGGAAAGDLASAMSVKLISEKITSVYREGMSELSVRNMLVSALQTANTSLHEMSASNEQFRGMGTTVVAAVIDGYRLFIAHAGDSRAYKLSGGVLHQLTKDHSVVQEMVENGELSEVGAKYHPRKNIITRALGAETDISVDFCMEPVSEDDLIIICTDGLTNFVEPAQIQSIAESAAPGECAALLVETANNNGGGDNITVVTISAK